MPENPTNKDKKSLDETHALEFDTAVTTFWGGSLLLDVKVSEVAAWGLDDADFV